MGQAVRQGYIGYRCLDVLDLETAFDMSSQRPLILVQQGDGPDQRQILDVVSSGAGAVVKLGRKTILKQRRTL